ncbi:complement factor B isoform X2 [Bombina bombina]|uniref:complement factor B isoform X2 n=1 Tax=Bombina bombina TaxID=8345 RepID=UPI00235AA26E|nr:complement factor B isoform X2 [Bombina bombina]
MVGSALLLLILRNMCCKVFFVRFLALCSGWIPSTAGSFYNATTAVTEKEATHGPIHTCGKEETIQGGYIYWPEYRTEGSTMTYMCPKGMRAYPLSWRLCEKSGQWSPLRNAYGERPASAKCIAVTCLRPTNFEYGFIYPQKSVYNINDTVTFVCDSGYKLMGSTTRTCLFNGQWSGKMSLCLTEEYMCPNPGTPVGGKREGKYFEVFSTVEYSCGNYELRGSSIRQCLPSGKWSGVEPRCERWIQFDRTEDLQTELLILDSHIRDSDRKSEDKELYPMSGKQHMVFFLVDASKNVGAENFDRSLKFVIKVVQKFSSHNTTVIFGVITFGLTLTIKVKIEDKWSAKEVIEVLKTVSYNGMGTSTMTRARATMQHIADHLLQSKSELDVLAIGIGDISKKHLESLVPLQLMREEQAQQHAFYLPYYQDLENIFEGITNHVRDKEFSTCGVQGELRQGPIGRIFGGRSSAQGDWPWQVYVVSHVSSAGYKMTQDNTCGGSVIGRRWILSAAHCFDKETGVYQPEEIKIFLGSTKYYTSSDPGIKVERIIQHEKWNSTTWDYDIALLKLATPLQYSEAIRPVCLPCSEEVADLILSPIGSWSESCSYQENLLTVTRRDELEKQLIGYVAGWGYIYSNRKTTNLQHTLVNIMPTHICNIQRHSIKFTENMFCARGNKSDACKGDSGGPLVMKVRNRWIQVGIVSFGKFEECGKEDFMGFYTNVPHMMSWIQSKITD